MVTTRRISCLLLRLSNCRDEGVLLQYCFVQVHFSYIHLDHSFISKSYAPNIQTDRWQLFQDLHIGNLQRSKYDSLIDLISDPDDDEKCEHRSKWSTDDPRERGWVYSKKSEPCTQRNSMVDSVTKSILCHSAF